MNSLRFALCLLLVSAPLHADFVIHKEKSLYRNLLVSQQADKRCLVFSVKRKRRNQTCIDVKNPDRIVFPYVRMLFAGLLVNPQPERALMIGLGGGTVARVLTDVFPDLTMDLVEVDRAVVKVARDYFDFRETSKARVHIVDGRVFTRRALLRRERYDLIILDAFTGDYIPEHLLTLEFMRDIASLLTGQGVVIANTFEGSALYDYESATYMAAFGNFLNLKMPGTGNRIIIATPSGLPDDRTLMDNARSLQPRFDKYNLALENYVRRFDRTPDWDPDTQPLTDQFSPGNLLRGRKR